MKNNTVMHNVVTSYQCCDFRVCRGNPIRKIEIMFKAIFGQYDSMAVAWATRK